MRYERYRDIVLYSMKVATPAGVEHCDQQHSPCFICAHQARILAEVFNILAACGGR